MRPHRFCCACLIFATILALAAPASAQRMAIPRPTNEPVSFKVGEKVEVWWLGKYYPGKVVRIDDFSGWLDLEFTIDGQIQTQKWPPNGGQVRKLAGGDAAAGKAAAKEHAVRTWTDSTGKFKIEASYAGQDAAGVKLKKTDGKTIQLALDKLSPQDQQYIAGVAAPPAGEANPFDAAAEVDAATSTDRVAEWNNARWVTVQSRDKWPLTPDGAAPLNFGDYGSIVLANTGRDPASKKLGNDNFYEKPKRILFDPAEGRATVILFNNPHNGTPRVRLSYCDLKTGRSSGERLYHSSAVPVDVSPSGALIAALSERGAAGNVRRMAEIHKVEGKTAKLVRRWNMGAFAEAAKQFEEAYFLGEDKLLTVTSWGGVAAVWDIDKAECTWAIRFAAHTSPAISPGHKQLAVVTNDEIGILDTASGNTLATIDADGNPFGRLAFSSDGKRIGLLTQRNLRTWDLSSGKPMHEVWFPKQMPARELELLGGNFAMVDNRFVIDLAKRIVLWEYNIAGANANGVAAFAGGKVWTVTGGHSNPFTLTSASVPDSAARAKDESLTADGVLALKPGARISLAVNLPGASDEEIRKATRNLTDQLKANGMIIDQAAPLSLEATINDGGAQTVKYSRFHFSRDGEEATVNKQISVLSLKENGTEIWTASGSFGAPSMVRQKKGQSIQEAVDEQKASPTRFFQNVTLPKYLARHPESGAYGSSRLN